MGACVAGGVACASVVRKPGLLARGEGGITAGRPTGGGFEYKGAAVCQRGRGSRAKQQMYTRATCAPPVLRAVCVWVQGGAGERSPQAPGEALRGPAVGAAVRRPKWEPKVGVSAPPGPRIGCAWRGRLLQQRGASAVQRASFFGAFSPFWLVKNRRRGGPTGRGPHNRLSKKQRWQPGPPGGAARRPIGAGRRLATCAGRPSRMIVQSRGG
ncbi:MAG: hypothetical protein J3K34DRAFT_288229 [Monoraphidium minutum]|nr:MAG: hypothetical protein J3K34DRAFT_288229 [Monoraphidium minutum]